MAYNEVLAERIRKLLARRKGLAARKMFGGIAFMLNGNMCCGVVDDRIVLRLGKDGSDTALKEPHIEVMDFTGRPIRSMVYLSPGGYAREADLKQGLDRSVKFTSSLPKKESKR
jgi:TfoX/Sxy family transcriptional regulator of competence genes